MYQIPDYTNVSVALSGVLAELGVNDVIVNKRRKQHLLKETVRTVALRLTDIHIRVFIFGSQIEGTTTRGMNADIDSVSCLGDWYIIQDCRQWRSGVGNLLMVEDEDTTPGYCMLQLLRLDAPLPETEFTQELFFRDRQGRIFLKNTVLINREIEGHEQHGPALTDQGSPARMPIDQVYAHSCIFQIPVVQHWLSQLHRPWPSDNIKKYIASCPCFVVPVGGEGSANEELEWRISTSLAERRLMFDLNVTQLQVYVLMKMLLKTSINYNVSEESHISSFMCKTVVLHSVQNTESNVWQSHTLIQCLLFSLFTLYVCVVNENCPHFIIQSNNLMAGKITQQAKYQLQENLQWLFIDIISHGMFSLYIDDVASRLMQKLNPIMFGIGRHANDEECKILCVSLLMNSALSVRTSTSYVLENLGINRSSESLILHLQYVQRLQHIYEDGNTFERSACRYLAPYLYTTLGSVLTSLAIQSSNIITYQVLPFFSLGLNSDVSSSRLKLATVFFCVDDMDKAAIVLRDLEGRYDINVCETICGCKAGLARDWLPTRFEAFALASDDCDVSKMISACVIFTQAEKNCVPKELHYEMYRSTREDLQHRKFFEDWMNWAVVDSLPYLHFLCYKVYGRLQRRADQQRAFYKLMLSIQAEPNLGHRETALNLLGQCMEQENRWNDAMQCYILSVKIRPRNNVANFHICKLLFMRIRQRHD